MICPYCQTMIPDGVTRCPCCGAFLDNGASWNVYQGTVENRNIPDRYSRYKYVGGIWFFVRVAIALFFGGILSAVFYGISRYCYNVAILEYNNGSVERGRRYGAYRNICFLLAWVFGILNFVISVTTSLIMLPFRLLGIIS